MSRKTVKIKKIETQKAHNYGVVSFERKRNLEGLLFVIPWLIGFIWFVLVPLVLSIRISFYQTTLADLYGGEFIGLKNYMNIFRDPKYWQTIWNSFLSSLGQVPVVVGFSLFVAVLLKQKFPGRTTFRVIFFIPVILAGVIMGYLFGQDVGSVSVFSSMLTEATGNNFIGMLFGGGLSSQIGNIMWKSSVEILIFLAALQSVPDILYEVVEIDGATAWESFWHVTVPYISPFIILNAIYALVDSFVDSSNPVMGLLTELTSSASGESYYGMASALSWIYMLLALMAILLFVLITRRWLK